MVLLEQFRIWNISDAPGVFEVDIQVAHIDFDTYYQTIASGNITAVDSTNQSSEFEF